MPKTKVKLTVSDRFEPPSIISNIAEENRTILVEEQIPVHDADVQLNQQMEVQLDKVGVHHLNFSLKTLPGESILINNSKTVTVKVVQEKIKILLYSDAPGWNLSFLAQSYNVDPRIELSKIIQMRPGQFYREGEVFTKYPNLWFPMKDEDYENFDVVMLIDINPTQFSDALKILKKKVLDDGLPLCYMVGPHSYGPDGFFNSEFADILPALNTGGSGSIAAIPVRFKPTAVGFAHPLLNVTGDLDKSMEIWRKFAQLKSFYPLNRVKPGSQVLVETESSDEIADKKPLVVFHNVGKGRVLLISSDEMWRWAFELRRKQRGLTAYHKFWQGIARWLVTGNIDEEGQGMKIRFDKKEFLLGEEVKIYSEISGTNEDNKKDVEVKYEIVGPGGLSERLAAMPRGGKEYMAVYRPRLTGKYSVNGSYYFLGEPSGEAKGEFSVESLALERKNTGMNKPLLQSLAKTTGGMYFEPEDIEDIPKHLNTKSTEIIRTVREPIWDSPWLFGLFLFILGCEWFWRRWEDLP